MLNDICFKSIYVNYIKDKLKKFICDLACLYFGVVKFKG